VSARTLLTRFRGAVARRVLKVGVRFGGRWLSDPAPLKIDIPNQFAVIGRVKAIEYDAVYDRRFTPARHAFSPGSRPLLAVGTQRGQVFLIGQGYRFTDRGFVDIDSHERTVEYDEKTDTVRPINV
jgi:hypothetical protein